MMQPASKEDIHEWLKEGKKKGMTHVIIVCDDFQWEDYPIYIMPGQDVKEIEKKHGVEQMERVMEIYNLSLPLEPQIEEERAWHY